MSTFWVAKNRIGSFMCLKIHNKIHDIKTLWYFSIIDYLQMYSINERLKDISTPTFQPQTFQPHGSKICCWKVRGWKVHGWKVWGWKVQGWSLGLKVRGWGVLQPQWTQYEMAWNTFQSILAFCVLCNTMYTVQISSGQQLKDESTWDIPYLDRKICLFHY